MNRKGTNKQSLATFFLYAIGFLLLWEWLRPVDELTETANISVFIGFLLLAMSLSFLKVGVLPAAMIKSAYILYFLHHFYFEGSFLQLSWLAEFLKDTAKNIGYSIQADWGQLSYVFRSLLFFILLWLMTYLIHYWLIVRRQVFVFFFMTLVYITVLDTFTTYEADLAIVRTVVLGFAVMGVLTFYRLLEKEIQTEKVIVARKWIIPLVLMIASSAAIGFAAPKADPIWPDPVPYITSYNEESGAGTVNRVGYGTDDSSLGGPFVGDDTIVYVTEADERNYWKVESKDVYTGKGWDVSVNEEVSPFAQTDLVPLSPYDPTSVELEEATATVTALKSYPHLIYPLGVKNITAPDSFSFELDNGREKIYSLEAAKTGSLDEYSVTFFEPKYSLTALKATKAGAPTTLDQNFLAQYTQLPENLPQRVRDLASAITTGKMTWFEQARAIETYFGQNGFVYDQVNVLIPGEDDDYVDQFLFESKKGYCDNFSTSMVVMLRSLGIPSRWSKGYTEGEYKRLGDSGKEIYEITNNNAHSWVEVYLPEVGWVPFEPTQGFTNPLSINYDEVPDQTEPVAEEATTTPEVEKPDPLEKEESNATETIDWSERLDLAVQYMKDNWTKGLFALGILAFLGFVLYQLRLKWLPYVLLAYFKGKKKDEDFIKAYTTLLAQLNRSGLVRKQDQTLRDYANYIDSFFSTDAMGTLTARYEQYLYKGQLKQGSWNDSKELWENLIKKTIA